MRAAKVGALGAVSGSALAVCLLERAPIEDMHLSRTCIWSIAGSASSAPTGCKVPAMRRALVLGGLPLSFTSRCLLPGLRAQDIEFTVQEGKLFMLQCRGGKRTGQAAFKIAVDLVDEGVISEEDAMLMVRGTHAYVDAWPCLCLSGSVRRECLQASALMTIPDDAGLCLQGFPCAHCAALRSCVFWTLPWLLAVAALTLP